MPDILIRGLDDEVVKRLKRNAKRNGRSLQKEAQMLIERSVGVEGHTVAKMFERWDARFTNRKFSGSVDLIRADRAR
jgi:plasmid stability protein